MTDSQQQPANVGKALVAYFSHSGNTRILARHLQEAAGADVFEIKPVTPYRIVLAICNTNQSTNPVAQNGLRPWLVSFWLTLSF
jgi:hypothetical protein